MKSTKLALAVLAAIIGVGSAYAFQPGNKKNAVIARWYTPAGEFQLVGSTLMAHLRCVGGTLTPCLISTVIGIPYITIYGEFH